MLDNTWTILCPEDIHPSGPKLLDDIAELVPTSKYDSSADLFADIGRFDAIIVRIFPLSAELLANATQLKVISKHGVGLDNVDIKAATECGIRVCITPGQNVQAVAEHAIALLFAVQNRLRVADRDLRNGIWDREKYVAPEMRGCVLGLYGLGAIGRRTAELARGIGMDVEAYDPYVDRDDFPEGVEKITSPLELCSRIDFLSVHAPLTPETAGAIGAAELDALHDGAVVINTARGELVDEGALVNALADGAIAGVGQDAFVEEPPRADHPLFDFENVVVTPHVAGSSLEAIAGMSEWAAQNVLTVYRGEVPEHTVNAAELDRQSN